MKRWSVAVPVSLAALAAAAVAARALGPALTLGVEAASSSTSGWLGGLQDLVPFGFAFGAGMVSVVNPCGFAMLPAYLALYLDDTADGLVGGRGRRRRVARAVHVSVSLTAGFVLLFGAVGVAVSLGARSLVGVFPWFGALTGGLLVLAGAHLIAGGSLASALTARLGATIAPSGSGGAGRYVVFGIAYGTASLSCTLPVFLAVLGGTLTLSRLGGAVASVALYALGMGAVITVLTLTLALFRGALAVQLGRAERWVGPFSAALLVVVGAYLVYYWLTAGGLLSRA